MGKYTVWTVVLCALFLSVTTQGAENLGSAHVCAGVQDDAKALQTTTRKIQVLYECNKYTPRWDYANNKEAFMTLSKLVEKLSLEGRKLAVTIVGYASPLGGESYNCSLALRRANALRDAISRMNGGDCLAIEVVSKGEDWSSFIAYAEQHYHGSNRSEILTILRANISNNAKEQRLRAVNGGQVWKELVADYMSSSRSVVIIYDENSATPNTVDVSPKVVDVSPKAADVSPKAVDVSPKVVDVAPAVVEKAEPEQNVAEPTAEKVVEPTPIKPIAEKGAEPTAVQVVEKAAEKRVVEKATEKSVGVVESAAEESVVEKAKATEMGVGAIEAVVADALVQPRKIVMAARTNLLVPALNVGVEVPIGTNWSVGADYYFPWVWPKADNKNCFEFLGWGIEGRYWFGRNRTVFDRLQGHSVGVYGYMGYYDFERNYHGHQGEFMNVGIDYTYAMAVGKKKAIHLEFSLGVGYIYSQARKYSVIPDHGVLISDKYTKHVRYFGPTKANVSLVVPIFKKVKPNDKTRHGDE